MESILGRLGTKIWRMRQRTWLKLFGVACVIWLCWYPKRMDSLFMALPADATVATYHKGLASEWKDLVNNKVVIQMLKGFGVKEADDLRDNVGIYQTLYWLTGRHTVIGFVPQNQPGDLPGYLAGSSYVGWKAKPMEFLWRIKWVPGLGRLGVTSHGTRYLKFDDDNLQEMGLVLGLDLVDGVLVATFSRDPETVCVMADRLRRFGPANSPAVAFGDERPWENLTCARHKIWITDAKLVGGGETVTAEMSPWGGRDFNLSIRGGLNVAGTDGTKCFRDFDAKTFPGGDVPDSAATLLLAFDAQRVSSLGGIAPPDRKALYMGTAFLPIAIGHLGAGWVSGKPFEMMADKLFLLKKAVAAKGFDIPEISGTFTQTDYFNRAQELFGMDSHQLTRYLWDTYNPSRVWVLFTAIAIAASVLLFLYDRFILKGRDAAGNNQSAVGSQQ